MGQFLKKTPKALTVEELVPMIRGGRGFDGVDGIDGLDGKDGKPGKDGKKGDRGEKGLPGKDGKNGKDGINGINGKDGSPDTPEEIIKKINKTKNSIDASVIKNLQFPIPAGIRMRAKINGVEQNEPIGSINFVGTASHQGQDYTFSGGSGASPLTTKGDIYTFDTASARLGVGTDGQALVVDSTQATGLKWSTITGSALVQTAVPIQMTAGQTRYISCGGASLVTAESKAKVPQFGGTYSLVKVYVTANNLSSTCIINLRVNSTSGNPTITIPSAGTGIYTSTGTTVVSVDDLVNYEIITDAGTGSVEISVIISKIN